MMATLNVYVCVCACVSICVYVCHAEPDFLLETDCKNSQQIQKPAEHSQSPRTAPTHCPQPHAGRLPTDIYPHLLPASAAVPAARPDLAGHCPPIRRACSAGPRSVTPKKRRSAPAPGGRARPWRAIRGTVAGCRPRAAGGPWGGGAAATAGRAGGKEARMGKAEPGVGLARGLRPAGGHAARDFMDRTLQRARFMSRQKTSLHHTTAP